MRALPAAVKLSLIIVNIIVAIVLVMAAVSLAIPGHINVDLPPEEDWTIGFQGNFFVVDVPLRLYNGASYDLTGLQIGVDIRDQHGGKVVEQVTDPQDVRTGGWTDVPVHFVMDTSAMSQETLQALVFSNDTMRLNVSASVGYFFSLAKGKVVVGQNITLGPLVSDIQADVNSTYLAAHGSHYDLVLPFWFDNRDMLDGQSVQVSGELRNSTAVLGSADQELQMPLTTVEDLAFHLTDQAAAHLESSPDNLTIDLSIDFHGAELGQTYHFAWAPGA